MIDCRVHFRGGPVEARALPGVPAATLPSNSPGNSRGPEAAFPGENGDMSPDR